MPYYIHPKGSTLPMSGTAAIVPKSEHMHEGSWTTAQGVANHPIYVCPHCQMIHALNSRIYHLPHNAWYCEAYGLACEGQRIPTATIDPAIPVYPTREHAHAACPKGSIITFIGSADEIRSWRARESARFADGTYLPVPWLDSDSQYRLVHYVHLSVSHPGLVAYTKDDEHGIFDRQTRVKPGRYLTQYYADTFTKAQIDQYVSECVAGCSYSIATSAKDIRTIYMATDLGFSSCMQMKECREYEWQKLIGLSGSKRLPCHPCEVYAGGDLAVAYRGPIERVLQRAVVWPSKRTYYRIYGSGTLETLLHNDGYTQRAPKGAKLRRIAYGDDAVVMPYIDGLDNATDTGKYIILDNDGDISCDETRGYSGDAEPELSTCSHCDEQYDPESDDCGDGLCGSCYENTWLCERCNDRHSTDDSHTVGRESWCQSCVDSCTVTCEDESCNHTWIEQAFTSTEQRDRIRRDVDDLCRDCAARYLTCADCHTAYDPSGNDTAACPDCGTMPRCTQTGDLLAAAVFTSPDPFNRWFTTRDHNPDLYWYWNGTPHHTRRSEDWHLWGSEFHPDMMCAGGHYIEVPDPRVPVLTVPRPISEYRSDDSVLSFVLTSWQRATAEGQCLVHTCQRPIREGDRFLRFPDGFAWCLTCARIHSDTPTDTFPGSSFRTPTEEVPTHATV